jgi:hypothetical protein
LSLIICFRKMYIPNVVYVEVLNWPFILGKKTKKGHPKVYFRKYFGANAFIAFIYFNSQTI